MESEYLNLLRLFHDEHGEYMAVGGYAVIAHGFPRTTGDIDILMLPTAASAACVVRTLVQPASAAQSQNRPPTPPGYAGPGQSTC